MVIFLEICFVESSVCFVCIDFRYVCAFKKRLEIGDHSQILSIFSQFSLIIFSMLVQFQHMNRGFRN